MLPNMLSRWTQWIQILGWIVAAVALGSLPFYNNGVFFPNGHAHLDIVLLILLALYTVGRLSWALMHRKSAFTMDTPSAEQTANQEAPAWSGLSRHPGTLGQLNRYDLAFIIYSILYILALRYAASLPLAIEGAFDTVALIFPYGLMRLYGARIQASSWLLAGVGISSVIVNIIGMANGWNQFSFPDAIVKGKSVQVASVFQYHNSYAAFVSAVVLCLLIYVSVANGHLWLKALYTGIIALNLVGLILSGSRGALLFWILMMILSAIGLRGMGRTNILRSRFLLYFYAAIVGAVPGYVMVHKGIMATSESTGWLGILLSLLIPLLIVAATGRLLRGLNGLNGQTRLSHRKLFPTLLSIGIAVGLLGALLKSHALLHKLSTYKIQQLSVTQRFIFWEDGLRIVARNPLFGSGYGAWAAMFERVESYSYYSTQVHSFLMDTLMNVGILGLLALLVAMWPMFRAVIWPWQSLAQTTDGQIHNQATLRAFSALGLMLFAHALMDWDMAFLSLLLLFILGLGAANALRQSVRTATVDVSAPVRAASQRTSISRARLATQLHANAKVRLSVTSITALAALITLFEATQTVRAEALANAANAMPVNAGQMTLFQKAHALAPYNPLYLQGQANVLLAGEDNPAVLQQNGPRALQLLEQAAALDPYNASYHSAVASLAFDLGKYKLSYSNALAAYHDAPFFPANLSLAINAAAIDGMQSAATNPTAAKQAFIHVHTLYRDYEKNLKIVNSLPPYLPPMGPYQLTEFSYDSLAVSALALGALPQAQAFAEVAAKSHTAHTAQVADLLLLITLGQQNQIPAFLKSHPEVQSSYTLLKGLQTLGVKVES